MDCNSNSVAMLAPKRLVGVRPEVKLSGPTKRTEILQEKKHC